MGTESQVQTESEETLEKMQAGAPLQEEEVRDPPQDGTRRGRGLRGAKSRGSEL